MPRALDCKWLILRCILRCEANTPHSDTFKEILIFLFPGAPPLRRQCLLVDRVDALTAGAGGAWKCEMLRATLENTPPPTSSQPPLSLQNTQPLPTPTPSQTQTHCSSLQNTATRARNVASTAVSVMPPADTLRRGQSCEVARSGVLGKVHGWRGGRRVDYLSTE